MVSQIPLTGKLRMQYETPPQGITLTGYIVRRMHKTRLLAGIEAAAASQPAEALAQFAVYAAAAATSWGPALYQPAFDSPGAERVENDPDTGALVRVVQKPRNPHYQFTYEVELPGGGLITGRESITGTTVGLRGLGMPAPSFFMYSSPNGEYEARASGVVYSELGFGFPNWVVRGYGELSLEDNQENRGQLTLDRSGKIQVKISLPGGETHNKTYQIR